MTVSHFYVIKETFVCTGGAPLVAWGENRRKMGVYRGRALWKEKRKQKNKREKSAVGI